MSKSVISVRNISKKYAFGERLPYYSFRDTLSSMLKSPFQNEKLSKNEFFALKNISFDVDEGDVVGVIGRNGAGKSTLLKILSRITPPTIGEIVLRGRVASLLEVGTGFHPELTGRENVFLNGAILGMTKKEINMKFDEIINFAEVEKFIDTPVKHYSSGMYMRLAFSVAAHLEPEILVVDEVLAVGDTQFQKKCLGKMSEVSKQGRTVLFVSHNMSAIEKLCHKSLLLESGTLKLMGKTSKVIEVYMGSQIKNTTNEKLNVSNRTGDGKVIFKKLILNSNKPIVSGSSLIINALYESTESTWQNCRVGISIKSANNNLCFVLSSEQVSSTVLNLDGKGMVTFSLDRLPLSAGRYYLDLFFESNGIIKDSLEDCYPIDVKHGRFYSNSIRQVPIGFEGRSGTLVDFSLKYD